MANFFQTIFIKNSKLNVNQLIVKKTVISFFFLFRFGRSFYRRMEMAAASTSHG